MICTQQKFRHWFIFGHVYSALIKMNSSQKPDSCVIDLSQRNIALRIQFLCTLLKGKKKGLGLGWVGQAWQWHSKSHVPTCCCKLDILNFESTENKAVALCLNQRCLSLCLNIMMEIHNFYHQLKICFLLANFRTCFYNTASVIS